MTIAGSESERWLRTAWPSVRPVEAVLLRGVGADQLGPSSEEEMARLVDDDNTRLAYVLFTSGSTGVPKGVAGYHHAVLSRVGYWHDAFPYEPEEESLHHITYLRGWTMSWSCGTRYSEGVRLSSCPTWRR